MDCREWDTNGLWIIWIRPVLRYSRFVAELNVSQMKSSEISRHSSFHLISLLQYFQKLYTAIHQRILHIDIQHVTRCIEPISLKTFRHFSYFDQNHLFFRASLSHLAWCLTSYNMVKQVVSLAKQFVSPHETKCFTLGTLSETHYVSAV